MLAESGHVGHPHLHDISLKNVAVSQSVNEAMFRIQLKAVIKLIQGLVDQFKPS